LKDDRLLPPFAHATLHKPSFAGMPACEATFQGDSITAFQFGLKLDWMLAHRASLPFRTEW
jgi:hypothetical protein